MASAFDMNILFIHDTPNEFSGAESVLRAEMEVLEKNGHEVYLCSFIKTGVDMIFDSKGHAHIFIESKYKVIRGMEKIIVNYRLIKWLRAVIADAKPDIIHIHNNYLYSVSVLLALPKDIPVIQTVHDCGLFCASLWGIEKKTQKECSCCYGMKSVFTGCYPLWRYILFYLRNKLFLSLTRQRVSYFITPSLYLMRRLKENGYGLLEHIPSMIETHVNPSQNKWMRRNKLLYIGRLSPEKGIAILIRTIHILLKRRVRCELDIIGRGSQRQELLSLANHLNLNGHVRFLGYIRPSDLWRYYAQAKILVYPSLWAENCPVTILEAMSHGVPVVASRMGGLPELIEDNVTGMLFNPTDSFNLADKIEYLLKYPTTLENMSHKLIKRYQRKYTPEVHYNKLIKVYHQIINEH